MRVVPIELVKENEILGRNIYDSEGRILLKGGMQLKENFLNKLKEMNILSIYITDTHSDDEINKVIPLELRKKTIKLIKKFFNDLKNITLAEKYSGKHTEYLEKIEVAIGEILEEILNNKAAMVSLIDIKFSDNSLYSHSLNVAIISLLLGVAVKLPKNDLKQLAIGALLHDIGKVFIPKELLNKGNCINEDEQEIMKLHTNIGYNYLKDLRDLSYSSKIIAIEHHERVDGSGYPNKLKNGEMSYLSKIVSIADAYDRLCIDTFNHRALSPNNALEYLMANAGTQFDYDIIRVFCKIVEPFAKGTLVNISTKEIAVVENTIKNFPLRPIVKIVKSFDEGRIGQQINLIEENTIVIESICYDA